MPGMWSAFVCVACVRWYLESVIVVVERLTHFFCAICACFNHILLILLMVCCILSSYFSHFLGCSSDYSGCISALQSNFLVL